MGFKPVATIQERNLGIIVDSFLKTSTQCAAAIKKLTECWESLGKYFLFYYLFPFYLHINPWYAHIFSKMYWNQKRHRKKNKNDQGLEQLHMRKD